MKRYKAFDPPEYAEWKLHPSAMRAFRAPLAPRAVAREVTALPTTLLLRAYDGLLRARLYDVTLKRWVKQGVLSKAWLGTGEEAVTVGSVLPLEDGDVVGPMIRNAGAAILRGMPLVECFRCYLATPDGVMRGRDLHVGDFERGVYPPISMVGSFVPVLAGVAFAMQRAAEGGAAKNTSRVAVTWVGDGASRTGEFHEGMSLAASLGVPLLVVLQNNAVALGTRSETHLRGPLEAMPAAYGVPGFECDGNNVVDTYLAARRAVGVCRAGKGPAILVATTFRMGSHATHDEAEARRLFSKADFEHWGRRDPIGVYEEWLVAGDRDLAAWVAEDGAIREEPAVAVEGRGRGAGAKGTRGAGAAGASAAKPVARATRNRAVLARVEARAIAEIEAAAEEALASRQKAFTDADATEGVYEAP